MRCLLGLYKFKSIGHSDWVLITRYTVCVYEGPGYINVCALQPDNYVYKLPRSVYGFQTYV